MRTLLAALLLITLATSAEAFGPRCETNPLPGLIRSTVLIERNLEEAEQYFDEKTGKFVEAIRGTAWFVDKKTIATIGHVVTGAKLGGGWKEVTLAWSEAQNEETSVSLEVRVQLKDIFVGYQGLEPIMTLELEIPVEDAFIAPIRYTQLENKEAVVGLGYRDGILKFAVGYLNYPASDGESDPNAIQPPPYLPFEIFDADEPKVNDRMVFNHGASGAPLFDCEGQVVAVVHALMTWPFPAGKSIGIPEVTSSWGNANMTAASAANMIKQ